MERISIAIAIVLCALIGAFSYKQAKLPKGTISVKGCAEKQITSDFVKWDGVISTSSETLVKAYEKIEQDLQRVERFFKEEGVEAAELTHSPLRTITHYKLNSKGHQTNDIEKYTLSQEFQIASADIAKVGAVAQKISSLMKEEIEIISYSPQYYYQHIDEMKIRMLSEAAEDAKARADAILCCGKARTGYLKSAHQGVFQITPAFSNIISDYGEYDTTSIEKRIKAVVTMEFGID